MRWFYVTPGHEKLAVHESEIAGLAVSGVLRPQTLLWHPGLENWSTAGELRPELFNGQPLRVQVTAVAPEATVARGALAPLIEVRGWLWAAVMGFALFGAKALVAASIDWWHRGFVAALGDIIAVIVFTVIVILLIGLVLRLDRASRGGFDDVRQAAMAARRLVLGFGIAGVLLTVAVTLAVLSFVAHSFFGR
jgi:GYF domain 2